LINNLFRGRIYNFFLFNLFGGNMLLEEIKTKTGKVIEEDVDKYKKAEAEFLERYTLQDLSGTTLIKEVFRNGDELLAEYLKDNEITCHRGCSHCCKQLICCTTIEMENIFSYLETLVRNSRRIIMKKISKEAMRFATWYGRTCLSIPEDSHKMISEPIRSHYYGKPCVFLKGNVCSIYQARPITCRTTKVRGDFCGKPVPLGYSRESKPIKLAFDQVLTEIIKNEERRIHGEVKVMPLRVWPLDKKFKEDFFK